LTRILFVDDEAKILEGLQHMLRPQRQFWDMEFAPGAHAALRMLEAAPFDVVVSDMRMPGTDGATLLKVVREKYPNILRIILSAPSESEAAFYAVPVAHQFLLKPCDQEALRNAIDRASRLNEVLNSKMLASVVGSIQQLPSLPKMCLDLQQALADPDVTVGRIAGIVESDTAMSAKVLQLANSAFCGAVNRVSDVRMAIGYLGINILQSLVLSAEMFRIFRPEQPIPGFSLEANQAHSQLTARITKDVAGSGIVPGVSLIAGLLHDVGKLVLAEATPKHFANAIKRAQEEKRPLYEVEEELTGVSHAEVGAYLLSLWGIPYLIIEAVAHHHHPERVHHEKMDLLSGVYFANWLAHEQSGINPDASDIPNPPLDPDIVAQLSAEDKIPEWRAAAELAALELSAVSSESE
jgi:HD-like signal output (HDOD) protein